MLNFSGVPVCLISKMQSVIALSTLKAEHIVPSQGMREIIKKFSNANAKQSQGIRQRM